MFDSRIPSLWRNNRLERQEKVTELLKVEAIRVGINISNMKKTDIENILKEKGLFKNLVNNDNLLTEWYWPQL